MAPQDDLTAERAAIKLYEKILSYSPDPEALNAGDDKDFEAILQALKTARQEALREAGKVIPTNWCDPLLGCIKKSPCPEIEQLLHGIKAELDRLASEGG